MILTTYSVSAQYITIDNSKTPVELVQSLFPAGSCVQPTNISINGYDFGGGAKSYAAFDSNGSGFPLNNGLIISTGKASSAIGPNSFILSEGPTSWAGDSDLQNAINENNTINATVVEFDFTAVTNHMSFDYVFSSEQYLSNPGSNQCNYSDGFAFLLRETGSAAYENLAVVPGTNIPVKVTTVRAQTPNCPAANTQYFGGFNNNDHPTNFNGQTIILTAEANVIPGTSYHIKMVIADQGNNLYDSAIFIGGNSFNNEIDLGDDRLIANNNPLCEDDTLALTPSPITGAVSYTWLKNSTPIPGYTNVSSPNYTITEAGDYTFVVNQTSCSLFGYIKVEYASITVNNATLIQCDDNNDGITTFNLTNANTLITGGNSNLSIEGYYRSLTEAQNQQNRITNPTAFQNSSTNNIVTVRIENRFGCKEYAEITLQLANNILNTISPVEECDTDDEQDGFFEFNLNEITQEIATDNTLPTGYVIQYFATPANAVVTTAPLSNPFTNTVANQQVIYARIINGPDCYGILPVTLKVNTFQPSNFNTEQKRICKGRSITIGVSNIYDSYSWNTTPVQTTSSITVSAAGTYTITATNNKGCTATKTFTVLESEAATINDVQVISFSGNGNTITVLASGSGNYEYSLDNEFYQDENIFTDIPPGEYTIYVRDKNGCGPTATKHVYVLDYPNFFTPNGDGFNDTWFIKNLHITYPNAKLFIFNRYGKLLKQVAASGQGWDGILNNNPLPSDDYWFTLQMENGKTIKGHFALKR
ncbi:choice-of-anchor L domain-containing protein [Flavobacterium enshiense]|uniref:T9SS type B sorting domain-containing protein n=1 Tax=Flavobacterium enshiense TaxID=1341165 RepID=UPI00345C6EFC